MSDTENKCRNCQIIGFIIAAIVVGLISYWMIGALSLLWAIIGFVILVVLAILIVMTYCNRFDTSNAVPAAAPAPAPAPAAEPEAETAAPAAAVAEGEEDKPEMLSAPKGGKGDDLKKISGVGPKLEQELNEAGVWHYDQIANWTTKEVAWADENLIKFKGRITRDDWVKQAKELAKG